MKISSSIFVVFASYASAFAPVSRTSRAGTALNMVQLKVQTGRSQLDPAVIDRFAALPFPADKVLAEYVWVDAEGNTRSKTRTLATEKVRLSK